METTKQGSMQEWVSEIRNRQARKNARVSEWTRKQASNEACKNEWAIECMSRWVSRWVSKWVSEWENELPSHPFTQPSSEVVSQSSIQPASHSVVSQSVSQWMSQSWPRYQCQRHMSWSSVFGWSLFNCSHWSLFTLTEVLRSGPGQGRAGQVRGSMWGGCQRDASVVITAGKSWDSDISKSGEDWWPIRITWGCLKHQAHKCWTPVAPGWSWRKMNRKHHLTAVALSLPQTFHQWPWHAFQGSR